MRVFLVVFEELPIIRPSCRFHSVLFAAVVAFVVLEARSSMIAPIVVSILAAVLVVVER